MDSAFSVNKVEIRLTEERWLHITESHDDLIDKKSLILNIVSEPDFVVKGIEGELIASRKVNKNWIVVVYKELSKTDGFIITAFTLSRITYLLKREAVWKKQL